MSRRSLALAAKTLGVPTVLTTVGAKGSILADPLFSQISDVFSTDALLRHGGGVSLAAQYLLAQVAAGLVPMPTFK